MTVASLRAGLTSRRAGEGIPDCANPSRFQPRVQDLARPDRARDAVLYLIRPPSRFLAEALSSWNFQQIWPARIGPGTQSDTAALQIFGGSAFVVEPSYATSLRTDALQVNTTLFVDPARTSSLSTQ